MISSPINTSIPITSRLLFIFVAGLLLAGNPLIAPVSAAPSTSELSALELSASEAADPPTLVNHLRASLHSRDAVHRQNALMDVVIMSACQASCTVQFRSIPNNVLHIENEAGVGTAVDLDALAPDLLAVYRNSRVNDGEHLLALAALINIDNRATLVQLIHDSTVRPYQQSQRIRRVTQLSLAAHYRGQYPELITTTNRNNSFSIEDVDRAEALRVKQAKKNARKDAEN